MASSKDGEATPDPAAAVAMPDGKRAGVKAKDDKTADAGVTGKDDETAEDIEDELDAQALDDEGASEQPSKGSVGSLLRDSAIIIAGGTILLYVTSHMIGTLYLNLFGVGAGFQGSGLANLSVLTIEFYIALGLFTLNVYLMLTLRFWPMTILGVVAMLLASIGSGVLHWWHDVPVPEYAIGALIASPVSLIAVGVIRLVNRRGDERDKKWLSKRRDARNKRNAELDSEFEQEIAAVPIHARGGWVRNRIDEAKSDPAYKRLREEIKERKQRRQILAWLRKANIAVFAGFIVVGTAIPTFVTIAAITATQSEGWVNIDQTQPSRKPVYWVGDRVVYLTTEEGQCIVTVQIDGAVQARRKCPPIVAATNL